MASEIKINKVGSTDRMNSTQLTTSTHKQQTHVTVSDPHRHQLCSYD